MKPIDFRLQSNLIVVDAELDGSDVSMILDTGAGSTVLSNDVVERLGLEKAGTSCAGLGAGGEVQMDTVRVTTFAVGPVRLNDLTPVATDLAAISDRIEEQIDGVIGFDFLRHTRLSIDYAAQQLVLEQSP